jgi:hypothetical protein
MTLVTLLSTCAMLLGLGGILPQLFRMVRTRSAGGQAPLGWGMGLAAHVSMAYVNFFGFHSTLLSASNIVAGSLCGAAIVLITVLGRRGEAVAPSFAVDEMATQEFVALREAVLARETQRRPCGGQPARRGGRGRVRTASAAAQASRS